MHVLRRGQLDVAPLLPWLQGQLVGQEHGHHAGTRGRPLQDRGAPVGGRQHGRQLSIEHKQKLIAEIQSLKKKTTDTRSLAKQLVTLEGWVEREEKRILYAEEELEASREMLEARKIDYQIEVAKLISLKEAMVKEAETKAPDAPQTEMDIDVPVLESQELAIRRQLAGKKDDKGVPIGAKRMKGLVKEADGIREKIAKRVEINDEPRETAASTAPRTA